MKYRPDIALSDLPRGKQPLLNGSRTILPCETWGRIEPLLRGFGITRVGDITGLDRIGIDVWIAVRPNSRTLSVSQGKGPDPLSARVSAAMEAIETACAERPDLPLEYAAYGQISGAGVVVDVAALPHIRNSLFGVNRPVYWAQAADLIGGGSVWVPYEMVHADATLPWMPGSGSFLASTNGLASGNTRSEALLHAICEVVERDALALWEHRQPQVQAGLLLDLASVDEPGVAEILRKFRAAEIAVMAWDVTSDIGLAVVRVIIFDRQADAQSNPAPAAFGAGCHPNRMVALVRALTEAAQSRLTVISGSRDDFGRNRYRTTQSAQALAYYKELSQAPNGARAFPDMPCRIGATVEDDLAHVLRRLSAAGMRQVLAVDLDRPEMPIAVVRVIVPGLEGPTESPSYIPGARVRALAHA
jgi:ribosomal protein S12 methylthiotransferase accessory factor